MPDSKEAKWQCSTCEENDKKFMIYSDLCKWCDALGNNTNYNWHDRLRADDDEYDKLCWHYREWWEGVQ